MAEARYYVTHKKEGWTITATIQGSLVTDYQRRVGPNLEGKKTRLKEIVREAALEHGIPGMRSYSTIILSDFEFRTMH